MAQDDLLWMKDFLQDDLYLLPGDKTAPADPLTATVQETPALVFNCLGPVDSGFLILVNYAGAEHIPADHLQALSGILSRKNISEGQYTILNMDKQPVKDVNTINAHFSPERILIMGEGSLPTDLLADKPNTLIPLGDVKTLYSLNFTDMLTTDDKKRAFWAEMKNF